MNMGIIAEDDSDVAVVREITLKLVSPYRIGFKRFVGNGCGRLRRKCGAWASRLVRQGCTWIVVVHDLDANNERQLRDQLSGAIAPAGARASVVLIPKREIEAWLLYDAGAIAAAFRGNRHPRLPGNPEALPDPKRYLQDLVHRRYGKVYLHTVHNPIIARHLDVSSLRRCPSFAPHLAFSAIVRTHAPRPHGRQRQGRPPLPI